MTFINGVLKARYPFGGKLVSQAPKHINNGKTCVDTFLPVSFRSSASMVMKRMGVLVHECGHFYDTMVQPKRLAIAEGLTLTCSSACGSDNKLPFCPKNGKETFPRSLITKDQWSTKHKPCPTLQSKGCDTYAYIYLNGDADNGNFESGDQGFDLLMEEAVQYVHSLATGYAFKDKKGGFGSSSSDRDGILTFLWYMQRYLHMARTKHPKVHKRILGDACWRQAILNVWGRAWLFLNATENMGLGIQDAKLKPFVMDPVLLNEIKLVRTAHGC